MKKMFVKILSMLLVLIMVVSIFPMSAFNASAATSGTCGDNVTWSYNTSTGTLTISGTGEMKNYKSDDRPWEVYEDSIRKVVIQNGVTSIGSYAFYHCESIYNVSVGDSVTVIGDSSFWGCMSLESINIPNTVKTIERYGFQNCRSLKSIVIPGSVERIGFVSFAYCKKLESVTLCSGLKEISLMAFSGCESLKTIFLPDTLTKLDSMAFEGCESLTGITVDRNNPYFSNDKYGVLYNKDKTKILRYPEGNTRTSYEIIDSVTIVGDYSFASSGYIEEVIVPEGVTVLESNAFNGCINLSNIEIPESVTTIEQEVFANCKSIKTIELSKNIVSICYSSFTHCSSLRNITVDEENQYYSNDEYGVLFNKDKTTLIKYPAKSSGTSYTIPDSVTLIDYVAFEYCNNLISVTIPDSVKTIENCAFAWSENIEFLIIGTGVEEIGYAAFDDCNSITDIYYCGTSSQWDGVYVDYLNDCLLNARIHYKYCRHNYDAVVTPSTCTEQGYTTYICKCGDTYIADYVDSTGHSHTAEITTPATHTSTGVMTYTCSCGDTYTETIAKIAKHNHNAVVTAPTCEDKGYTTYTCECGDTYVADYVDATGHSHTAEVTTPATHTATGVMTYTCSCGDTYTEIIGKIVEHSHNAVVTAPTCTEQGYTTFTCECGDSYVDNYVSSKWHIFTNYEYNNDATEYLDGTKTAYCDYGCGTTHTIKEIGTAKNPTIIDIYPGQTKKCILESGTAIIFRINSMEDVEEGYWFSLKYPKELTPPFDPNNYFDNLPIKWNDYYNEIKYGTLDGGMGDCLEGEEYFSPHISKAGQIYYIEVISQHDESIEISLSMSGCCKPEYPTEAHTLGDWVVIKPATSTQSGKKIRSCTECGTVLNTQTIPAFGKVNSVSVSDVSLDYKGSTTITPNTTVDSGVKYTVTYSSSNPSVASVDANGKVTTSKTGSATITVTVTDEFGNTVSDTCTVKVNYNWWQWIIVIVLFGWIWY